MNSLLKLAQMGCGEAILSSVKDRGSVKASITNAKTFLKYYKYAVSSGISDKKSAIQGITPYLNKLKEVEYLVKIYSELYEKDFRKIKLQVEKFIKE